MTGVEGVKDPAQMRWLILEKLMGSGVSYTQWEEMTEKLYNVVVSGTSKVDEYHDDETMDLVRRAIETWRAGGGRNPNDLIHHMQNAGILFRERR